MLVRRQPARSLMVRVCAAVLVLLPLLAAFTTATAARDIGDGSLTIVAWQCRQGVDADAQLPAGFEAECTTRADLVTFVLTDPAGSPELEARRQTGYPKRNDPAVWFPPFGGPDGNRATITLETPQPETASVVFCSDGGAPTRQALDETGTVLGDIEVKPAGLQCDWYFVPGAAPTPPPATPVPTTPPATPIPTEPTATSTVEATTPPETATTPPEPTPVRPPIELQGPYTTRALPRLTNANVSFAQAINNDNVVVGYSGFTVEGSEFEWMSAVRWVNGGHTVEALPMPEGAVRSFALDINDRGQIVGVADFEDGTGHAVLWTDDVPQELGTLPGGTESGAYAINNLGQVVGISTTGPDQTLTGDGTHAFLWENGVMVDLGLLRNASKSSALDINDASLIVGNADGANAIQWTPGDREINVLGRGAAFAVSSTGVTAGVFVAEDGYAHAILWYADRRFDLGTYGELNGRVEGVNAGNVVVGGGCPTINCQGANSAERVALMWMNGEVINLADLMSSRNDRRWDLRYAYDINDRGSIVGFGVYAEDESDNKFTHGFLMLSNAEYSIIENGPPPPPATETPGTETPETETPGPGTPTETPETETPEVTTDAPREIPYLGEYYLRDRELPPDFAELRAVGAFGERRIFVRPGDPPYAAIYLRVDDEAPERGMIRYLSEQITRRDQSCPAEPARQSLTPGDSDAAYAFAGYEEDLPGAYLSPLVEVESGTWYYESAKDDISPLPEIYFVGADGRYQRWVLMSADPEAPVPQLRPGLAFGGQALTYRETLEDDTGLNLGRVGCAGPFKVSAEGGQASAPFRTLYIDVAGALYVYDAANATPRPSSAPGQVAFATNGAAFTTDILGATLRANAFKIDIGEYLERPDTGIWGLTAATYQGQRQRRVRRRFRAPAPARTRKMQLPRPSRRRSHVR